MEKSFYVLIKKIVYICKDINDIKSVNFFCFVQVERPIFIRRVKAKQVGTLTISYSEWLSIVFITLRFWSALLNKSVEKPLAFFCWFLSYKIIVKANIMNELFIQHVKSVVHSLLDHVIEGDTSRSEIMTILNNAYEMAYING